MTATGFTSAPVARADEVRAQPGQFPGAPDEVLVPRRGQFGDLVQPGIARIERRAAALWPARGRAAPRHRARAWRDRRRRNGRGRAFSDRAATAGPWSGPRRRSSAARGRAARGRTRQPVRGHSRHRRHSAWRPRTARRPGAGRGPCRCSRAALSSAMSLVSEVGRPSCPAPCPGRWPGSRSSLSPAGCRRSGRRSGRTGAGGSLLRQ